MSGAPQSDLARVQLPQAMDLGSAAPLVKDLLALRGRPIRLDASRVERLGGLGLQTLLAARLTWRADKLDFTVVDPSAAFTADCALLGASGFLAGHSHDE
jgi:chemotaxis protein CheX